MNYKVIKEELAYKGFFKIRKDIVEVDRFKGDTITKTVEVFERGDSVAILLKERDTGTFLFTNQFRYPTAQKDKGWILELPAGSIEQDEDPKECVNREVEEELGYVLNDAPMFISKFYVSPGGSSERIHLYYCEVTSRDKIYDGGGLEEESEDIELVKLDIDEAIKAIGDKIIDAKSIIALQWYQLHKKK